VVVAVVVVVEAGVHVVAADDETVANTAICKL